VSAESVINCRPVVDEMRAAFKKLKSKQFQKNLKQVVNPYGNGGSYEKIVEIIRSFQLKGILKKIFYDINT
jgi:UDP-N-acetylglucosamine 2-epimerase